MVIVHTFYGLVGVFVMCSFSAYHLWFLPTIDLSSVPFYGSNSYACPTCGYVDESGDDFYVVGSKTYPICCNERLSGGPDGTIHDWDEVHCCRHCGHEYWFSNGCF